MSDFVLNHYAKLEWIGLIVYAELLWNFCMVGH